jgi:hypothetical protein
VLVTVFDDLARGDGADPVDLFQLLGGGGAETDRSFPSRRLCGDGSGGTGLRDDDLLPVGESRRAVDPF